METFRLFFVMFLQICKAGTMEMNCFHQYCTVGYQFCEPQKMICRQCSDFDDYCFKDNFHIANCSTYCKETFRTPDTRSCNNDLWIYIPTGVSILVICLSLGPVIYRRCRKYRKVRHNLYPTDTTPTDEKEQETSLMKTDTQPKDQVVYLRRLEEEVNGNITAPVPNGFVALNQVSPTNPNEDTCGAEMSVSDAFVHLRELEEESNGNNTTPLPNGFKPLNQVPATNEHTCIEMSVSDKKLNPRDNSSI